MSRNLFHYADLKLYFDGYDLSQLPAIQNYQQPVIVYKASLVQERLDWLHQWKGLTRLHFAVKANYSPDILKLIRKSGAGVDVVSHGEILHAIDCGFTPADIIFSGVGKTVKEITWALQNNIYQINVESLPELIRIKSLAEDLGINAQIGLRINPEVDAKTHPNIATALVDSKFGLSMTDLDQAIEILKSSSKLVFKSISYHLGSQIVNTEAFRNALQKVKPLFKKLQTEHPSLTRLDLGGGLGIDYRSHDNQEDQNRWQQLKEIYETELVDVQAEFLMEMGRFVVARSGLLISQVQYIKKTQNKKIVILDVGMNNLMRPSLYQAYHHLQPLVQKPTSHKYMVVGPVCESSDVFHSDIKTTELAQGDLVALCDVGAYGKSMASNYNIQPIAVEYVI